MKAFWITLLICLACPVVKGTTFLVKLDSVKTLKLKTGQSYKIKTAGTVEKLTFQEIKGDSVIFSERSMHYTQISALRNKKRSDMIDAVMFPATVGSCLTMSSFPIAYFAGYFRADTEGMLRAVGLLAVETIIFYVARNYLSANKRWIDFSKLEDWKVSKKS